MESSTISLEELANDLGSESSGNEWTSEDEKKRLESAVQLILERASRKLGSGSFPTSITIKTSASGSSASFVAQESPVAKRNEESTFKMKTDLPVSQAPSFNLLIESFSLSSQQQQQQSKVSQVLPQTCSTPILVSPSSSSPLLLSTGEAKKQKKFRLDADELKPAANSTAEPVTHTNEISQSQALELFNERQTETIVDQAAKSHAMISDKDVHHTSLESEHDSDDENDDDMESMYGYELKGRGANSNASSGTNHLNESMSSLYTIRPAPTLATGRKSKDVTLPPVESAKRQERRNRNKEAAARCRRKREDQTQSLTKQTEALGQHQEALKRKGHELQAEKNRLEKVLQAHEKVCQHASSAASIRANASSGRSNSYQQEAMNQINQSFQTQQQQQQHLQHLIKIRKEEIDDIKKISSEKIQQKLNTNTGIQNNVPYQASNNTSNNSVYLNFSSANYEKNLRSPDGSRQKQQQQSQQQQQQNQLNHELFQQMLHQSSKLLTPQSGNSISNSFESFSNSPLHQKSSPVSTNSGNQLKRPGNLNLNKQPSPISNNNELAKKIKQEQNNTAALYQFFNSASNGSFMNNSGSGNSPSLNPTGRPYNPSRTGILLTPTFQLNTPILNYGHLSFALTPLIGDYPITPSVLQQHLVNTPNEKFGDQNNQGGL